ncbi:hypothetical protein HacjB3_02525 [Halalkalicoccus jeotgali B3]|uniref:Uncharacterized protein n=1 Tax=Halalkalicoccus jeotgali (strain DSM 18796 / CECT 7217 / JCM 14584 / KCTC 4019 / B3) TaxID=795797 RepID=D8J6M1_HALJB|nr:hypothetical protein HacjB3_02525 [Halalkalicoccus jeotgali B3]
MVDLNSLFLIGIQGYISFNGLLASINRKCL